MSTARANELPQIAANYEALSPLSFLKSTPLSPFPVSQPLRMDRIATRSLSAVRTLAQPSSIRYERGTNFLSPQWRR